jgi:hypothetical protein
MEADRYLYRKESSMGKRKTTPIKTRRKVTLSLDIDADERLSIQARRNGVTRSKLASELVGKALAHIVVSIRHQAAQGEAAA